jgi:Domain of unknown function (DUF4915)
LLRHFISIDAVVSAESVACCAVHDEARADGWCVLQIVNLVSGDIVQWIRIEGAVSELYDVAVLPGVRRPMAASFTGPRSTIPSPSKCEPAERYRRHRRERSCVCCRLYVCRLVVTDSQAKPGLRRPGFWF